MKKISRLTALLLALLLIFQMTAVATEASSDDVYVEPTPIPQENLDADILMQLSNDAAEVAAAIDTVRGMGVTANQDLIPLRNYPNLLWGEKIVELPAGTFVVVYDTMGSGIISGEWYKVCYNGQDGYIHSSLLNVCTCTTEAYAGLEAHDETCPDKMYCISICALNAEEIYNNWANYTEDAQAFILFYLAENDAEKLAALNVLILAIPACDCGNTENPLSIHSDGCARKSYFKAVAVEKTAQEIYANWAIYPVDGQEYIIYHLNEMSGDSIYAEKLAVLKALIEGVFGELVEQEITASYGDMTFAFSGVMPENAQITVSAVSDEAVAFVADNFTVDGLGAGSDRYTYALDLKITVNGIQWQPEDEIEIVVDGIGTDGERIADHVTAFHLIDDANAIVAQEGAEVQRYFIFTGDNLDTCFPEETTASGSPSKIYYEELDSNYGDIRIREDGSVVLSVDSFSDFYFTVDFAFNGIKHVIPGGSTILLSELFAVLGIERDVSEVTDVRFEDGKFTLVSIVKQVDGDWLLTADEAFTTEELLIITFADGTILEIVVTDASYLQGTHTGTKTYTLGTGGAYNAIGSENFSVQSGIATIELKGGINDFAGQIIVNGGELIIKYASDYDLSRRGSDLKRTVNELRAMFVVNGGKLTITGNRSRNIAISGACSMKIEDGKAVKTEASDAANSVVAERPLIVVNGGTVDLDYVLLTANWNEGSGSGHTAATGSAVHMNCSSAGALTMDNCVISNCYSYQQGPALAFNASAASSAVINNTKITGCYTGIGSQGGGTIRSVGTNMCTLTLNGCEIYKNYTLRSGGAIAWNSMRIKPLAIKNCDIHHNTSSNSGGGVSCGSKINITDGTKIHDNTSGGSGGGMYINVWGSVTKVDRNIKTMLEGTDGSVILDSSVSIYGNTAANNGGGIMFEVDKQIKTGTSSDVAANDKWNVDKYTMNLTLNGASITGNKAGVNGGGIAIYKKYMGYTANLHLNSGTVSNNTAQNDGGGIYVQINPVNIGTDSTTFTISNNTSSSNGGGIALRGSELVVNNGTVSYNNAVNGYGGGVYITDFDSGSSAYTAKLTMTGGIVENNKAEYGGGYAVYAEDDNGITVNASSGKVNGNTATASGGGIYMNGAMSNMTITGAEISSNDAVNGGGIYMINNAKLIVEAGSISKNIASSIDSSVVSCGGGIYMDGTATTMSVTGGNISDNKAGNGGGIYLINGANLMVTNGKINGNQAIGTGSETTTAYSQTQISGVGGGISVANGASATQTKIQVGGNPIGVYGNTAEFAADDVFASGVNTKLNLPARDDMSINDSTYTATTGWFEDYASGDTAYEAYGLVSNPNIKKPERYRTQMANNEATVRAFVNADELSDSGLERSPNHYANDDNVYVCITLGVINLPNGSLTIQKVFDSEIAEAYKNQIFVFSVTGKTDNEEEISFKVQTQGSDPVTITNLPQGTYTVTEDTNWSWRFDCTASEEISLTASNQAGKVEMKNELVEDQWLDYDISKANTFETVTSQDPVTP